MRIRKVISLFLICIAFGFVFSCLANAEPPQKEAKEQIIQEYEEPKVPEEPNFFFGFLRLILSLAFVIFLAYLVLRIFGRHIKGMQRSEFIEIIDVLPVGPNRGIYIAEIADKVMVLGITEHNITFLEEITDSAVLEAIQEYKLSTKVKVNNEIKSFSQYFKLLSVKNNQISNFSDKEQKLSDLFGNHLAKLKSIQNKIASHKGEDHEQ